MSAEMWVLVSHGIALVLGYYVRHRQDSPLARLLAPLLADHAANEQRAQARQLIDKLSKPSAN